MKRTVRILCAAAAALMLALPLAGCDAVKDTANQVRDGVNSTVDRVNTFELERDADTLNNAVKTFYAKVVSGELNATTAANRMAGDFFPGVVTCEELIRAMSGAGEGSSRATEVSP